MDKDREKKKLYDTMFKGEITIDEPLLNVVTEFC